jgi:GTP-binding protein YchF
MQTALIGMPKSGKTTLLNALTRGRAESFANPSKQQVNIGISKVYDPRLAVLTNLFNPQKVVPAEIQFMDIPSAVEGGPISGQALNLLQESDVLAHVVRAFVDHTVPYHLATVDPQREAAAMDGELILSDMAVLERRLDRIDANLNRSKGHERDLLSREAVLVAQVQEGLENGVPVREQIVSPEGWGTLMNYNLLTTKPLLVILNGAEDITQTTPELLSSTALKSGLMTTSLSAKLEWELTQLSTNDEKEFRESLGVLESGAERVIATCYALLGLVSFFTFGSDEVRAWSVPLHISAQKAAGKIHSDIERGFIRAEVINFEDMVNCEGSVSKARKQGLVRLEGKTYPVKDGDLITFLFNV